MQILKNRDLCPPEITSGDSFRFVHRETNHVSQAPTYYDWIERIRSHRSANSLPPVSEVEAMDQLCKTLPPEYCEHNDANSRSWVNPRLSWGDIAAGVVAYAKLALSGFKTVSQDESNRRARICAGCFLLVPIQGCGACSKLASLIVGDVAQRRTNYDEALNGKACAACACPTKSLVHFPLSLLEQADPGDAKQPAFTLFCWRKKTSENYLPQAA
jgi:hypothetical protein